MADLRKRGTHSRKRLRDVCKIVSGGTPSKANAAYWGGAIPWVTARDLKSFDLSTSTLTITPQAAARLPVAPAGSVLVLVRGMQLLQTFPVGCLAMDAAFNQDIRALIPGDQLRGRYLAWQLRYREPQILRMVDIAGHGTGRLGGDLLRDVFVSVPALTVQDKAIATLDSINAAESALKHLLAEKRRYKRGLMQELLTGRRRLPAFASLAWTGVRLGEVFTERRESGRPDLPLLSITGARGVISRDDVGRRDSSSSSKAAYKRIAPGDLGYNTMRMWQGVSGRSSVEGIVSPAYTVIVPRSAYILSEYAAHLFKAPAMIDKFRRFSQGLVDDTLNLKYPAFARVRALLPGVDEQACIVEVLDAADDEIDCLTRMQHAFEGQRAALMDRILGKPEHQ